jgi:PEP-CTERM motif
MRVSASRTCTLAVLALTSLVATDVARGGVIDVIASTDGYAVDATGTGTFTSVTQSPNNFDLTRDNGVGNEADRALFVFQLPTIPVGAHIVSVSLLGNVNLLGSQNGNPVDFQLVGYTSNGSLAASDATAAGPVVGSASVPNNVNSLGPISISIDLAFIESKIGSATFIGLTGTVGSFTELGLVPLNNTVGSTPLPTLEFVTAAVPEPGSITLLALGAVVVFGLRRRLAA